MKITADTNVLIRVMMEDDAEQAKTAKLLLASASVIAVPVPVLCELVWVLRKGYGRQPKEIASAITALMQATPVLTEFAAVEAGLAALMAGGDFADGVIAYQGLALDGKTFVSFDRKAVKLLRQNGFAADHPAEILS